MYQGSTCDDTAKNLYDNAIVDCDVLCLCRLLILSKTVEFEIGILPSDCLKRSNFRLTVKRLPVSICLRLRVYNLSTIVFVYVYKSSYLQLRM